MLHNSKVRTFEKGKMLKTVKTSPEHLKENKADMYERIMVSCYYIFVRIHRIT